MSYKNWKDKEKEQHEWEEAMKRDRARRDGIDLSSDSKSSPAVDLNNSIFKLVSRIESLENKNTILEEKIEELESTNSSLNRKLNKTVAWIENIIENLDTEISNKIKEITIEDIVRRYDSLDIDCLENDNNLHENKFIANQLTIFIDNELGRQIIKKQLIEGIENENNDFLTTALEMVKIVSKIYDSGITKMTTEEGNQKYHFALDSENVKSFLHDDENSLCDKMSKIIDVIDNLIDRIDQ
jgi:hypothetical protein